MSAKSPSAPQNSAKTSEPPSEHHLSWRRTATFACAVTATLGACLGYAIRDEPAPVVATLSLLVGLFGVLGLTRFAVAEAEYRAHQRRVAYFASDLDLDLDPDLTPIEAFETRKRNRQEIRRSQLELEAYAAPWLLLPHVAVTAFAVATAAVAFVAH